MGIPINLPYEQFLTELSNKEGVAEFQRFDFEASCKTKFAGLDTCNVIVYKNDSGYVEMIAVEQQDYRYETGSSAKLKVLYDEKYGSPVEIGDYLHSKVLGTMNSFEYNLVRYTYKKGVSQIDFVIFKSRGRDSEFLVLYYPRGFEGLSSDDI